MLAWAQNLAPTQASGRFGRKSLSKKTFPARAVALIVGAVILSGVTAGESADGQFVARVDAAMSSMMAAMAVKPSGDTDRDFVASMIPHHQGAIDMAEAELTYGKNERLRRIAQEIIVTQQQEITAMRLALKE